MSKRLEKSLYKKEYLNNINVIKIYNQYRSYITKIQGVPKNVYTL